MKFRRDTLLIFVLISIVLVTEITVFLTVRNNYNRAQKQRDKQRETTEVVLRESYAQKCLLLIPNAERTQANIERCDEAAKEEVEDAK